MNRSILITLVIIIAALLIMVIIGTYASQGFSTDILLWILLVATAVGLFCLIKKHNTPQIRYAVAIIAVLVLGISFAGILIESPFLPAIPELGFSLAIVLILLLWRMKRQSGDAGIQDERTLRIGTYSISCSWYLMYILVIFLSVAVSLGGMQISPETILLIFIILMPISALLFQYYFNRKGDVS